MHTLDLKDGFITCEVLTGSKEAAGGVDNTSDWGGNLERDYSSCELYLNVIADKFKIKWSQTAKGCFLIETKEGKKYYYYPKKGKWRSDGKAKYYQSRNLYQFLKDYVFKWYSTQELELLKEGYTYLEKPKVDKP